MDARERLFGSISAKARQVLVLTEGVIPYLSTEEVGLLATDLFAQRNFRYWITDYFSTGFLSYYRRGGLRKRLGPNAPFRFFPDDWEEFFKESGWSLREMKYLYDEGVRLSRPPPVSWPLRMIFRLMPPKKRLEMARMTGYGLLERDRLTF